MHQVSREHVTNPTLSSRNFIIRASISRNRLCMSYTCGRTCFFLVRGLPLGLAGDHIYHVTYTPLCHSGATAYRRPSMHSSVIPAAYIVFSFDLTYIFADSRRLSGGRRTGRAIISQYFPKTSGALQVAIIPSPHVGFRRNTRAHDSGPNCVLSCHSTDSRSGGGVCKTSASRTHTYSPKGACLKGCWRIEKDAVAHSASLDPPVSFLCRQRTTVSHTRLPFREVGTYLPGVTQVEAPTNNVLR